MEAGAKGWRLVQQKASLTMRCLCPSIKTTFYLAEEMGSRNLGPRNWDRPSMLWPRVTIHAPEFKGENAAHSELLERHCIFHAQSSVRCWLAVAAY